MKKQEYGIDALLGFLSEGKTPFHAVAACEKRLTDAGFTPLSEGDAWNLTPGAGYYVTRNRSSILAFRAPRDELRGFMIAASHTDSPTFRVKHEPTAGVAGGLLRLNVEGYGGMILSSWLDRPLTLAGRLTVREGEAIKTKLVFVDRDLCVIPSVAIHLNREVNKGCAYNPAIDLQPLLGTEGGDLLAAVADAAGVARDAILSFDLSLCDRSPGVVFGLANEFFSSPRIDDLECVFGTLAGFLSADVPKNGVVPLFCAFDNEETGSGTRQGAASDFLSSAVARIARAAGKEPERLYPSSFLVSADNAHARHPNHPELSDGANAPDLNRGIVIKHAASQKYATDAVSDAIFSEICRRAGAPVQHFQNRSDIPGGSTLGNISTAQLPINSVDIGLPQLAMHSARETAGVSDFEALVLAMTRFFSSAVVCDGDGEYRVL